MAGEPDDRTTQTRGWARVARASADVYNATPAAGANAALFDAIEYAATEARLGMSDLVDAYIAGAPQLDMHEAWDDVEVYLGQIARMHEGTLGRELARIDRAPPATSAGDWRCGSLCTTSRSPRTARSAATTSASIRTRRAVQEVLDGARAAHATEDELDAYIAELRIQQCDVPAVIITAAWIATERARLAQRRATPLSGSLRPPAAGCGAETDGCEPGRQALQPQGGAIRTLALQPELARPRLDHAPRT